MLQTQIKQNMFLSHMIRVSSVEGMAACCWGPNFFRGTEDLCPTFQTSQDKSGAVPWALGWKYLEIWAAWAGLGCRTWGPFPAPGGGAAALRIWGSWRGKTGSPPRRTPWAGLTPSCTKEVLGFGISKYSLAKEKQWGPTYVRCFR